MEISQIRYFLAVCEHRNFTHAAQASHVSQPSLTAAIKKLEQELGGPLFLRDRAGSRLTPLGKLMHPRLQKIYDELQDAKNDAVRFDRLERVPIRIGLGETVGQQRVLAAIERFLTIMPQSDVELLVDAQESLFTNLKDGLLDIVISPSRVKSDLYSFDPLYEESYRVVVAEHHELAQRESVPLSALADTNMLDRPNCEMRETLNQTCAVNGIALYAAYRSNRVDWLLDLARQGAGAVILPLTAIPKETGLVSLTIDDADIRREVFAIKYRHEPDRENVDALIREFSPSAQI
ncbi:MAG: LysR family transcriptional regulator [Gammaproteobacteria bacterium]